MHFEIPVLNTSPDTRNHTTRFSMPMYYAEISSRLRALQLQQSLDLQSTHMKSRRLVSKCWTPGDDAGDDTRGDTRDAVRRIVIGRTELGNPLYIENLPYVTLYLYRIHYRGLYLPILF